MGIIEAIVLGIVEGFTEFLPVSSTGHMIIASSLMGIQHDQFTKLFEVAIQFGAILAVVVLYGRKFFEFRSWKFYAKLVIGVIPALALGYLFSDRIDALLESPTTVAISLLAGGVILMFIDKAFTKPTLESDDQVSFVKSFIVGLWQTIAMVPGVSRSAASIIGGMSQKFTRNLAAEFSFFLAVPTMFAAAVYSLFLKGWEQKDELGNVVKDMAGKPVLQKGYKLITDTQEHTVAFIAGNVVAFLVAVLAIRFFLNYLKVYGFRVFGVYRVLVGITLLALLLTKVIE